MPPELPSFDQTQPVPEGSPAPETLPKFDETEALGKEKFETPLQQVATVAEGAAQGMLGPIPGYVENKLSEFGVPGTSYEEQAGRRAVNPGEFAAGEVAGLAGGMLTGTGVAGIAAKGAAKLIPEGASVLAKVGSGALRSGIQMGLIQGADEISNAMLGLGDPEHPVSSALANVGAAGILGVATGGAANILGQGTSKGLQALQNSKVGTKLNSFLAGFGHAAQFPETAVLSEKSALARMASLPEDIHMPSFKLGQKAFADFSGGAASKAARYGANIVGYELGGLPGALASHLVGKHLEKIVNVSLPKASQKYIGPALLKALSTEGAHDFSQVLNYVNAVGSGADKIGKGVDALFRSGSQEALNYQLSEKDRNALLKYLEEGGIETQIQQNALEQPKPFAKGGEVILNQPNAIANNFPEQNVLLNTARGRISGYLSSQRPQPSMNLPFDNASRDPQHSREFNKILDLANQPLSVLKHIKNGTLQPKHVTALKMMFPELYAHLSKKMTEKIAKQNMGKDKKPPYKVRQALSLFLGSNLESSLLPQNIQAVQGIFAQQKAIRNPPVSSAAGLDKIGKTAQTAEQSRTQRLNKS